MYLSSNRIPGKSARRAVANLKRVSYAALMKHSHVVNILEAKVFVRPHRAPGDTWTPAGLCRWTTEARQVVMVERQPVPIVDRNDGYMAATVQWRSHCQLRGPYPTLHSDRTRYISRRQCT